MKLVITSILFLTFLGFGSCKKKQAPLTEEEVLNVIKRFDNGWRNKKPQSVDSVLAPAYVYFTQSGGTFSRTGVVETAGSSTYTIESVDRSNIIIQLYENTGVVSTRWQGKGVYRGVPFDEDQRCSITIVKTGDKVEILSEHCTPIKTTGTFH